MFVKFPSIEQFRNTVAKVSRKACFVGLDQNGDPIIDPTKTKPTITFLGTVKVHGTNAGISRLPDGKIVAQSRNRTLEAPMDNEGFRAFVEALPNNVTTKLFAEAENAAKAAGIEAPYNEQITIFGEWAGRGIQSNVAVNDVDKFFYVFGVQVGEAWVDSSSLSEFPESRIFNAHCFPKWEVKVDFNSQTSIAIATNKFTEITETVEKACPVGARFGASGTGEGVVWSCDDPDLKFKVKGQEHSVSKVKQLASADVEKVAGAEAFVANVVSPARVQQAIDAAREEGKTIDRKITGDIVRWVVNDILKEESDTIEQNGLDLKAVTAAVGTAARTAFFRKLDNEQKV